MQETFRSWENRLEWKEELSINPDAVYLSTEVENNFSLLSNGKLLSKPDSSELFTFQNYVLF